ncbi:LiaF transmembrane domain-containing protein [Haladaptatus sp. ZSTT2]|uniref:LiaF transmembrane domain-containing protein n=1 Tax=Haladaptatus sp. ZSTT2 TaxID=3120515 RepID=UPI00300F4FEF
MAASRRRFSGQLLTGGVIIIIGLLLLIQTTGLYDTGRLWEFVPSLFVLLGVWAIVRSRGRNLVGPVFLIVVAGTIQLLVLDVLSDAFVAQWWPLGIVLVGAAIILNRARRRDVPAELVDRLDTIVAFGGVERRLASKAFTGGEVMAIFGGADIDLRDATIAPPATLNVIAMFGAAEFRVPPEWDVRLEVLPILGGVEDSRLRHPMDEDREAPDLVITGFAAFGGVEITD